MNDTSQLTELSAKLHNQLTLDYATLESIFWDFRRIAARKSLQLSVLEPAIKNIEKHILRMHRPGSIFKKDIAFLTARNELVKMIDKVLDAAPQRGNFYNIGA